MLSWSRYLGPLRPSQSWNLVRVTQLVSIHSMASTRVRDMSAQELATLMRDGANDLIVVDVRDLDRAGGHIRGSINIYADEFVTNARRYAREWTTNPPKRVVFHCMYSQQRGPMCAHALADAVKDLKITQHPPTPYILTGGFRTLARQSQFRDLLEGYE